jgi:hypothetical protein
MEFHEMEMIPDDNAYNFRYLEVSHRAGYCQLYELNDRVSVKLIHDAARQLKMRWAEAWATLMRGNELKLKNSVFRLAK